MKNKPWLEVVALLGALLLGACVALGARAEERNPLYRDTIPGTAVPCCNKEDCHPVKFRMIHGGRYEIYLPMGYWHMPEERIIRKQVTPNGEAHACWQVNPAANYAVNRVTVFCVWIPIQFM